MTLAAVISYAMAIIIGVVVSLDVGGLLISQHKEFQDSSTLAKRSILHSSMHAVTHSLLFLLYFWVVSIAIPVPVWLIEWLATFNIFPPINIAEALRTMMLLSSILIIVFVWITYAHKIAENHVLKTATDRDKSSARRVDILFFYWIAAAFSPGRKSGLFYMALAVAVDMLAITSFIRVFFKTAADASSPAGETPEKLPHFEFSVSNPSLDPFIFAGIIFAMVLICSFAAILLSRRASDDRNRNAIRWMRIVEPFLVFWLLLVAVDHLFGNTITSVGEYTIKILTGALVAGVLTWLLVAYHGMPKIKQLIDDGYDNLNMKSLDDSRATNKRQIVRTLLTFVGSVFLLIVLLVVIFFASHRNAQGEFNGIDEFINSGSMIISGLSLLFLFIPIRFISEFEIEKSDILHEAQSAQADGFLGSAKCIAASYFVVLFYIHFSFSGIDVLSISAKETFLMPLISLGIVGCVTWFLLGWRSAKKGHFISDTHDKRRNHFNRNFGDLLGAFAGVVFIWQFGIIFL